MNFFHVGLAVAGSTLISKGVTKAIDAYAPAGFKDFLNIFDITSKDVGEGAGSVAKSFFGSTLEDPLDFSDLPSVSPVSPVSTAAGQIAAPGKAPTIPLGNSGRVAQLSQRGNVQTRLSSIPTVGIPKPRNVSPNINLGKAAVGKVKVKGIA